MAYIGTSPSNGVRRKHTYTATASQTSFSGAGAEGATLSYNDSNFVDVYQNGVKLSEADYTSTSGTAIVLATGATVSDIVEVVVYDVFSVADTVSKADGGTFDNNINITGNLHITGTDTSDQIIIENTDAGTGTAPDVVLFRNSASPADNDAVGRIDFRGQDDGSNSKDYATIFSNITDATAATAAGSLSFQTRNGSNQAVRLFIGGDGSVSTPTLGTSNLALGVNAGNSIASGGNYNVVVGDEAGTALTTGDGHVAIGYQALMTEDAQGHSTAVGNGALKLQNTPSTAYNTAVGSEAGTAVTTGIQNTLIGALSGDALTEANYNVALGYGALGSDTLGGRNTAIGTFSLDAQNFSSATNSNNTAVGYSSGSAVTTGIENTLIGARAGMVLSDADYNTAIGYQALGADTKGSRSTAVGYQALAAQNFTSATDTNNTAVGFHAGTAVTTGSGNTFVGVSSGDATDDGSYNVAVGDGALSANCGNSNVAIGRLAGNVCTGTDNVFVGEQAGVACVATSSNTFIGEQAGSAVTSGENNTIIGGYTGNAGSLDIRTANNNIVLSDGDGNVKLHFDSSGEMFLGSDPGIAIDYTSSNVLRTQFGHAYGGYHMQTTVGANTGGYSHFLFRNANGIVGSIATSGSGTSFNTSSDYRLKENVKDMTGAIDRVKQLLPKRFNFIADADTIVDGFLAHEAEVIIPEAVHGEKDAVDDSGDAVMQGIDQSKLVPLLTGALKEAIAKIEALETRVATLEG